VIKISQSLWALFSRNLGHCTVCIRKAFLAAASAWFLTFFVVALEFAQLWLLAVVAAAGLTLLWVAHLLFFAIKSASYAQAKSVISAVEAPSRRAVLPLFARAFISSVFLSVATRQADAQYTGSGGCGREGCAPCNRPFYKRSSQGAYDCLPCHSCGNNCSGSC
jgi:hypothetical protein